MKRLVLFLGITVAVSAITWALKAQAKPKEKTYTVTLPLHGWIQLTQQLDVVKMQLRQSDLPSKNVAYISDSLLTPIQSLIGSQVNAQLDAEKAVQQKKDTSEPKKN
jgi:hypothetical protein